jgi:hypothetical protein
MAAYTVRKCWTIQSVAAPETVSKPATYASKWRLGSVISYFGSIGRNGESGISFWSRPYLAYCGGSDLR